MRISAYFFCLITAYEGLIRCGLPASNGANQWENNKIRAEQFFDNDNLRSNVIVGSSLTQNLPVEKLGITNLGMAGGGPSTGLKLILGRSVRPGVLFVEVDETITRGVDKQLLNAVMNPLAASIRRVVLSTRTEYRPLSVAVEFARSLYTYRVLPGETLDMELRSRYIDRLKVQEAQAITEYESDDLRRNCNSLRDDMLSLRLRGWDIYVLDIPRDHALARTIRKQSVDAIIKSCLSEREFSWLQLPDNAWTAQDGVHIASRYAEEAARTMVASIPNLHP